MRKTQNYLKTLFLNYSVVLLLFLTVFFLFAMLILYREQYQKHVEVQAQLSHNVQNQIDSSLMEMDKLLNGLLFNKSFVKIMKETNTSPKYIDYNSQVMENFISLDAPLFSTYRIIAFNDNAYYTLTQTGEDSNYIKKACADYPWKAALLSADGRKLILPSHEDTFDRTRAQVYSVARSVTDGKYDFGFVEVQNLSSNLEKICSLNQASGSVVLFSPEGDILYPTAPEEQQNALFEALFQGICGHGADSGSLRLNGQQISYQLSDYSGWVTVVYCPAISFVPYAMNLILLTIAIYVLMAILSLFMAHRISRRMAAPLMELNQAISQISLNNMTFRPHLSSSVSEINNINRSFQQMLDHLQEAIARNVQSRAGEERANYLALQAQMNPHTLYNTLSMIESVSYMNGDKEVSALCVCLSQMLRYISDYTRREYTIQDELSHLENYSTLALKRYEGKLEMTVDAAPELLRTVIPKFTIQPLVENAVKHSFATRISRLSIRTTIRTVPGGWQLLVLDNGPGFTAETLETVHSQFEGCDRSLREYRDVINTKIGNLGLTNIYIRCRILYGSRFHMTAGNRTDSPGGFIEIRIQDPDFSPASPDALQKNTTQEAFH